MQSTNSEYGASYLAARHFKKILYSLGGFGCDRERSDFKQSFKKEQCFLKIFVTMQQWPDSASDISVNCPEMRVKVLDQRQRTAARFERVKERRRGPAESLMCFQMTDLIC